MPVIGSLLHWKMIPLYLASPFIVLFVKHVVEAIYNLFFHPLRKYPGPHLWAASSLPRIIQRTRGTEMWVRLEAHKKYGPVIRITPNELSWIEPGVWKDVWAHHQGQEEFMKHDMDRFRHPNGHYGILSAERSDHSRYRRLLSHAFSEKGMREQQPQILGYVDLLIKDLKEVAGEGPQDMVKWFNFTTFDVIGKLAFGQDFSCLTEKKMHPWIAMIFGNVKSIVLLGSIRRLGLEWVLPYIASSDQLAARIYNHNFTSDMMANRVARGTNQHDFWDNVLAHSDKKTGMSHEEMVSNAANLVLAGSETTATLLSGCLHLLMTNPATLAKITEEIRTAFTSDDQIDLFSTTQLPYTLAVLEETMRIYPPVPTQANRTVPAGGAQVQGQFLPAGTTISLSQYIANHYPSYWTKPESFIPERFLGGEEFKNECFDVMQPFSVGPRNCIGRNLAYAEMRLILCRFLWNFDVERVVRKGEREWFDQKTFILWEKHPLWVKLKPVVR